MLAQPLVGIQVPSISFLDEGVDELVTTLRERARVNAIFLAVHSFGRGIQGRAHEGFPDHGPSELDDMVGGTYFTQHPEHYAGSVIQPFRAPDREHIGVDVLDEVLGSAHEHGVRVYAWMHEKPYAGMAAKLPNLSKVFERDVFGRVRETTCLNNQEYRRWWLSLIEDVATHHPLDGLMYGSERRGPLMNLLLDGIPPVCFCDACAERGERAGIQVERARRGYRELYELVGSARSGAESPYDGYFVVFLRTLLQWPEILAWETLWTDGWQSIRAEIYGLGKAVRPQMEIGWHVWHQSSFSALYRAENDFREMSRWSDFIKPVLYHNCAGPRFHTYVQALCGSVLRGVEPEVAYPFLSQVLGLDEGPYEELPRSGFTPEYVFRETQRTIRGALPGTRVYPGIDVDIPTGDGQKKTTPRDVREGILAAFRAGADGVVLSRKYSEMYLENLFAAADALAELGVPSPAVA